MVGDDQASGLAQPLGSIDAVRENAEHAHGFHVRAERELHAALNAPARGIRVPCRQPQQREHRHADDQRADSEQHEHESGGEYPPRVIELAVRSRH